MLQCLDAFADLGRAPRCCHDNRAGEIAKLCSSPKVVHQPLPLSVHSVSLLVPKTAKSDWLLYIPGCLDTYKEITNGAVGL